MVLGEAESYRFLAKGEVRGRGSRLYLNCYWAKVS